MQRHDNEVSNLMQICEFYFSRTALNSMNLECFNYSTAILNSRNFKRSECAYTIHIQKQTTHTHTHTHADTYKFHESAWVTCTYIYKRYVCRAQCTRAGARETSWAKSPLGVYITTNCILYPSREEESGRKHNGV